MNYQKVYDKIISNAKIRNYLKGGNIIVETHHIVPKACDGSNRKENLVNLTTREHYICHLLLERIYRNTEYHNMMLRAAFMMGRNKTTNSRAYQSVKEAHIRNLRNRSISEEQKHAISKANKGNTARLGLKNTEEHKKKISDSNTGKIRSQEVKDIWSQQRTGKTPWNKDNKGYKVENYPKNRKSRGPLSAETIEKMRLARKQWHESKGHKINE